MRSRVKRLRPLPVMLASLLLACAPLAGASGGMKSAATQGQGKPSASPHGKKGSGINVSHTVAPEPAPGRPFSIRLELTGVKSAAGATVSLVPESGLEIEGPTTANLTTGGPTTFVVTGRVAADGVYFLNVFTTQDDLKGAESLMIRVGAGQIRTEKAGELKQTPTGEKIISMPSK